jgi:ribonuclease HI
MSKANATRFRVYVKAAPGGYAFIVKQTNGTELLERSETKPFSTPTTTWPDTLTAIGDALSWLRESGDCEPHGCVEIYTDLVALARCWNENAVFWTDACGMLRKDGEPVKHAALWTPLVEFHSSVTPLFFVCPRKDDLMILERLKSQLRRAAAAAARVRDAA